ILWQHHLRPEQPATSKTGGVHSFSWCRAPCWSCFLWRERGDDFFKARIFPQWIPKRQEFQLAIAESARGTDGDCKLFAGEIVLANPCSDHRQIRYHKGPVDCIFSRRKKLDRASAFA